MIELHITMAGKSFSPRDRFQIFNTDRKAFADLAEAKRWLAEHYGKAKRQGMYVDGPDGHPKRIGYVIGFRNADWSHAPVQHWIQQDWVEFRECKTISPKGE